VKPGDASVSVSQKVEPAGDKFMGEHEVEKLEYPKVKKETNMEKTSAQELPSKTNVDAGGAQFIDKGDKEKLQFPSKPAADPKVKQQGLDASSDAKKQIDGGEKEKLQFPSSGGPKIKLEWNVAVDHKIGENYKEKGEEGAMVKPKDLTPSVSAPRAKEEEGAHSSDFLKSSPMQKQFSINWTKVSSEEIRPVVEEALDCAILDLQVAASKMGVDIWKTPLANAMGHLVTARNTLETKGLIHLTAAASQESREALKSKYAKDGDFDMSVCIEEQKGNVEDSAAFCGWIKSASVASKAEPKTIKVQASAKEENPHTDILISDSEKDSLNKIGSRIF
jgi:hypothetical protein